MARLGWVSIRILKKALNSVMTEKKPPLIAQIVNNVERINTILL